MFPIQTVASAVSGKAFTIIQQYGREKSNILLCWASYVISWLTTNLSVDGLKVVIGEFDTVSSKENNTHREDSRKEPQCGDFNGMIG